MRKPRRRSSGTASVLAVVLLGFAMSNMVITLFWRSSRGLYGLSERDWEDLEKIQFFCGEIVMGEVEMLMRQLSGVRCQSGNTGAFVRRGCRYHRVGYGL